MVVAQKHAFYKLRANFFYFSISHYRLQELYSFVTEVLASSFSSFRAS